VILDDIIRAQEKCKQQLTRFFLLTLWKPGYDIFVLWFRPKKQQFSVASPAP